MARGLPLLRAVLELRILPADDDEADQSAEARARRAKIPPLTRPYRVPPGADLELTVALCYGNDPAKYAIAPKFPKKKTFSWWVVLGDFEVDELISAKRVMMPAKRGLRRRAAFRFCAPDEDEGEAFTLSIGVFSDSYMGLDQQYDFEVTTCGDDFL